jgi:calcium-dependent protein kinase
LVKKSRPTPNELLNDKWVKVDGTAPNALLAPTIVQRMHEFTAMDKLRRMTSQMMVATLPPESLVGLEQMFKTFDKDNSGHISIDELRTGLKKLSTTTGGKQLLDDELNKLVATLDLDGNGQLDYKEFVAATIHMAKLETDVCPMIDHGHEQRIYWPT